MLTWAISGIFAAPLVVRWGFRKTAMLGATLIISASPDCSSAHLERAALGDHCGALDHRPGFRAEFDVVSAGRTGVGDVAAARIATSSVQFFRTIGGAIGIGLLGRYSTP